jgi:hypothetical protein
MAVAVVNSTQSLTATVNVPSGTGTGLVLFVSNHSASAVPNSPSVTGWGTAIGTIVTTVGSHDMRITAFSRVVNSEPASYTVTGLGTDDVTCDMVLLSGTDLTSVVQAFVSANAAQNSSGSSSTTPNVSGTVAANGSMLLWLGGAIIVAAPATPAGWTSLQSDTANEPEIRLASLAANSGATGNVSSSYGSNAASGAFLVIVQPPAGPQINTQPANAAVFAGQLATFSVSATASSGGGTLSYQWKDDGSNVGTNSSTYTTAATTMGDNGSQITCVVTDSNGSTTTNAATLTVLYGVRAFGIKAN